MCIPYKYDLVRDVTLQSESKLNMCLLLNRAGFLLSSSSQRQSETFEVFLACQLVTKRRLCHPLVLYKWYDMPKSRNSPAAAFKVFTAMEVKDRPAGNRCRVKNGRHNNPLFPFTYVPNVPRGSVRYVVLFFFRWFALIPEVNIRRILFLIQRQRKSFLWQIIDVFDLLLLGTKSDFAVSTHTVTFVSTSVLLYSRKHPQTHSYTIKRTHRKNKK